MNEEKTFWESKSIYNFFQGLNPFRKQEAEDVQEEQQQYDPGLKNYEALPKHFNPLFSLSFDGEKEPGAIGDVVKYYPQYTRLRNRAWKAYLDSDITQTIFQKYALWVIGKGLKLQAEPQEDFIEMQNVEFDAKKFQKEVEAAWKVYANSKRVSRDKRKNLHRLGKTAFINAKVAGDCLVISRVDEKGHINIELVDGDYVRAPMFGMSTEKQDQGKNRSIQHGIVIDNETGEHIAYYVQRPNNKLQRVVARDKNGFLRAWMVYGLEYRIENKRGLPLITAVMETLAKLDRYKEATVGAAEERAKIAFSVEHGTQSTGESPMARAMAASRDTNTNIEGSKGFNDGEKTAKLITRTWGKTAINMPIDSKLQKHSDDADPQFKDFIGAMTMIVCATARIPMEVAFSKYDSNYSSSRAALKDWEHNLEVEREEFATDFYMPIYSLWLNMQVMFGKIQNQALSQALLQKIEELDEAIKQSRWIGVNVPHIDPLKEVQAERLKLGKLGEKFPLTTLAKALESLGTGDSDEVIKRFIEELENAKDLPDVQEGVRFTDSEDSSGDDPKEG